MRLRRHLLLPVLASSMLMAAPVGAAGAVRLGPDVDTVQTGGMFHLAAVGCQAGAAYNPCAFVNLQSTNADAPVAAPFDGVITQWRFRAGCCTDPQTVSHTFTLKTYNEGLGGASFPQYAWLRPAGGVRTGPSFVLPAGNQVLSDHPVTLPARLPIKTGERPAIAADAPIAFYVYDTAFPGVRSSVIANNSTYPTPGYPFSGEQYANWFNNVAIALEVTVEKDADNDGYGDDTQDCFPTDPTKHDGCAPVYHPPPPPPLISYKPSPPGTPPPSSGVVFSGPISPPSSGDGSKIYIPLACPKGALRPCGGYLVIAPAGATKAAARKAPKLLARVRYSVAPGKRKRLLVSLSGYGRRLLKSKRRLRVRITTQPNQGKAVSVRKTLVWRGTTPRRRSRR